MNNNKIQERTLVIIKPDGLQRSLVGDIIHRFERTGLKIVAIKFINATTEQVWDHYNKDDKWFNEKGQDMVKRRGENNLPITKSAYEYGKDIIRAVVKYITCCPIIIIVLEGNNAVGLVKKLVGGTEPLTSDVGTIRGDYTLDSYISANMDGRAVRNLIHCSDSVSEAKREIKVWIRKNEIINYNLISSHILYDINLDGLKE